MQDENNIVVDETTVVEETNELTHKPIAGEVAEDATEEATEATDETTEEVAA